ncbi:hypothetical protein QUF90_27550 [Desulfococcaceae bacterium HSG9]|nr:hypothetical protein [Desulfococcaceae bacterium HSG9]
MKWFIILLLSMVSFSYCLVGEANDNDLKSYEEAKGEPYAGMSLQYLRKNYTITIDQKGSYSGDRILRAEFNGYIFEIVGDDITGKVKFILNKYKKKDEKIVKENYKLLRERVKDSKIIHVE